MLKKATLLLSSEAWKGRQLEQIYGVLRNDDRIAASPDAYGWNFPSQDRYACLAQTRQRKPFHVLCALWTTVDVFVCVTEHLGKR